MRPCFRIFVALTTFMLFALAATAGDIRFQAKNKAPARVNATGGINKADLDCSGAITAMLDNTYSGTNVGAPNNVTTYSCSFWTESGGEVVYVLDLPTPTMFTAELIPTGTADLDLAVLDACDEDLGCLIVVDAAVETTSPVTGTFYLVVDGFNGAEGPYDLVIESQPLPTPVDFCNELIQAVPGTEGQIVGSGVFPISGDTCDGENHIDSNPCGTYTEAGLEHYYEVTLLSGGSIDVEVTNSADGALWLLDQCKEPYNCLAYADDTLTGQAESFSYMNTTSENQLVIIVVDSYGVDSCGSYTGTVTVNFPGVISANAESWGSVRGKY